MSVTGARPMAWLAAFSRFFNNEECSDLTIVITTEQPQACYERLRNRGAEEEAPRKRQRCSDEQDVTRQPDERVQSGGHASGIQATTSAPPAGGETPAVQRDGTAPASGRLQAPAEAAALEAPSLTGFTAVELHGHSLVLNALSEYFSRRSDFYGIASSRNTFNKRPGCVDNAGNTPVVVSVGSEEEIEAATLMVKSMYGIQLPEDASPAQVLRVFALAHQYRVEPALCDALQRLQHAMAAPVAGAPSDRLWLLSWPSALVRALYCGTSMLPAMYNLLQAEARCAAEGEASTAGQQPRALAEGILQHLRNAVLFHAELWTVGVSKRGWALSLQEWYCRQPAAEVVRLLSSEELVVACEQTVFAAAMVWLQANRGASTADRRAVWNCIRLLDLSPWALSVVLGGLPEASELMDPGSLQHMAACVGSGVSGPPPHLGMEGCSYNKDTLAWTQRNLRVRAVFHASSAVELSADLFIRLMEKGAVPRRWVVGGLQYAMQIGRVVETGGDTALFAWVVVMRPAWLGSHAKALRVGIDAGKFAVQVGAGGAIRVMDSPPPRASWRALACARLGSVPKGGDAAAHLRRLLAGTGDRPQVRVLKCDDAGVPLGGSMKVNGDGQPRYRGPAVRLPQPGA